MKGERIARLTWVVKSTWELVATIGVTTSDAPVDAITADRYTYFMRLTPGSSRDKDERGRNIIDVYPLL